MIWWWSSDHQNPLKKCFWQILRVYYDRLVDQSDREMFYEYLREVVVKELNENYDQLFSHLDQDQDGTVTEDDMRSLVFCDFSDPASEDGHYLEVTDLEDLRVVVESKLDEYNSMSKKQMNLVMFRYASESRAV